MILPSKHLLSTILNITVERYEDHTGGEYDPCFQIYHTEGVLLLNIYELMYLCRQWTTVNGYNIDSRTWLSDKESYPDHEENTPLFDMRVEGIETGYESRGHVCLYEFNHKQELKHEFSAIIQACEWILNHKESK